MPEDTLEERRLLSNLETEKEKLLKIILLGLPELSKRLKESKLRQLGQRITLKLNLEPLSCYEISDYVNFRLTKAGGGSLMTDKDISKPLYRFSRGIPRLINLAASMADNGVFH